MLVDKQIKERCEAEAEALISPFDENHVKSISYDLDIEGYINKDGSLSKERVCLHPNAIKLSIWYLSSVWHKLCQRFFNG